MTGRAAGYCAGYGVPGYMNRYGGRGFGRGRGWGARGFAVPPTYGGGVPYGGAVPYGQPAPFAGPTREQELAALKNQAEYLSDALNQVKDRIDELEKESETS